MERMTISSLLTSVVYMLLNLSLSACTPVETGSIPNSSITITAADAAVRNAVETLPAPQTSSLPDDQEPPSATTTFVPLITLTPSSLDIPTDLSDLEIYMEKTACEGPCPVYSVRIKGDGTVNYNGKTCVNVVGEQTNQLSQEEVQKLVEAFYENDFFALEDRYVEDIQDIPAILIRFTLQDRTKQVIKQVYDQSMAPIALQQLEDAIDRTANTQQWVTSNGTPAPCP